jgi:hypothetical protein
MSNKKVISIRCRSLFFQEFKTDRNDFNIICLRYECVLIDNEFVCLGVAVRIFILQEIKPFR